MSGLIAACERSGSAFAGTPKRAEPRLFIFLRYKDAESANNSAEAAIKAVRQRCREQLKTPDGMMIFGALLTCL
ncbi:hypothetical protein CENSYa_0627 [Cenarchaeum symbiosum A]|uniref:Transposase n=1 Tax=Cenarchaeum symbiosum (strain A) TaxID=414004 RepID=A0RV93_CENSY|nr:hypothetical protein CENSYa_0627 [Cenarchaeum symbiosum A]